MTAIPSPEEIPAVPETYEQRFRRYWQGQGLPAESIAILWANQIGLEAIFQRGAELAAQGKQNGQNGQTTAKAGK